MNIYPLESIGVPAWLEGFIDTEGNFYTCGPSMHSSLLYDLYALNVEVCIKTTRKGYWNVYKGKENVPVTDLAIATLKRLYGEELHNLKFHNVSFRVDIG